MKTVSTWKPEDQRSWEELERRAAAQARELYARRREFQTQEPPPETREPPEPPPSGAGFQGEPSGTGREETALPKVPGSGEGKEEARRTLLPREGGPSPGEVRPGEEPEKGEKGGGSGESRPFREEFRESPRGTASRGRSRQEAASTGDAPWGAAPSPQVPVPRSGYGQGGVRQSRQGGRGLAGDQLLLLALLWLLVEEKADTQLILAVAYILLL
jgi:hypothetical protein